MIELLVKYFLEGLAVAVAAYFIPKRNEISFNEVIFIALSAAATFAILDIFAPSIGDGARKGAGFGTGARMVGWPMEGFEEQKPKTGETAKPSAERFSDYENWMDNAEPANKEEKKDEKKDEKKEPWEDATVSTEGFEGPAPAAPAPVAPAANGITGFDGSKAYASF